MLHVACKRGSYSVRQDDGMLVKIESLALKTNSAPNNSSFQRKAVSQFGDFRIIMNNMYD